MIAVPVRNQRANAIQVRCFRIGKVGCTDVAVAPHRVNTDVRVGRRQQGFNAPQIAHTVSTVDENVNLTVVNSLLNAARQQIRSFDGYR